MKTFKFLFLLVISIVMVACSSTSYITKGANGEDVDTRLAGEWAGSEKDQQDKGMSKEWVMQRNQDGTFVLHFTVIQNGGESRTHDEAGNWWILDGKYYEFHEDSGETDVYTYKVLNKDKIKFSSIHMSMDMNNEGYEFIDTRKK